METVPFTGFAGVPDEAEDVREHPARQARFQWRALLACKKHNVGRYDKCSECGSAAWQVFARYRVKERSSATN